MTRNTKGKPKAKAKKTSAFAKTQEKMQEHAVSTQSKVIDITAPQDELR